MDFINRFTGKQLPLLFEQESNPKIVVEAGILYVT